MNRQFAPASARNQEPILEVLRRVLPVRGTVLEVASGTGQHAAHFAAALPHLVWQPSDPDRVARDSIAAWAEQAGLPNLAPPLDLDTRQTPWPLARVDALVCINMLHIAPWGAAEALFAGAAQVLAPGAPFYLYGPYRIGGQHTSPGNAAFDDSLKQRDPGFGVRDLERVKHLAETSGFGFREITAMPANNYSVVFERLPSAGAVASENAAQPPGGADGQRSR
ncbi:DUF938 domain-containing protein [Roseospirillum parvum]|uniref:SAM-dependent methyltransferase n=1 Tax=Roseospirillum parvum TaxID=83401 RepID=A0A1G8BRC1_9PROT|nr:DUF938 domain-containing protein [Roseospirillum parvum]SDH35691.1 Protein of unknown function [Roseospirillum parvum]